MKRFREMEEACEHWRAEGCMKTLVEMILHVDETVGGTIYVAGNGGSSAIASHFAVDMMKTANSARTVCLTDNVPLLTALANDVDYESALSGALDMHRAGPGDLVLVISSSGNSPNVVKLLEAATRRGCDTVALVGFDGGKCQAAADHVLHVKSHDYGIVEDCHHAVLHELVRMVKLMKDTDGLQAAYNQAAEDADWFGL